MKIVDRAGLQKLQENGAQVIEVLPRGTYGAEHIKGAVNVPLKKLDKETVSSLDRKRPTVAYCSNYT